MIQKIIFSVAIAVCLATSQLYSQTSKPTTQVYVTGAIEQDFTISVAAIKKAK